MDFEFEKKQFNLRNNQTIGAVHLWRMETCAIGPIDFFTEHCSFCGGERRQENFVVTTRGAVQQGQLCFLDCTAPRISWSQALMTRLACALHT